MIEPRTQLQLDPADPDLVHTVLQAGGWHPGGWHPGRAVDTSEVERHYRRHGVPLGGPARAFFGEFYGVATLFCFRRRRGERWSTGGLELMFDTTTESERVPYPQPGDGPDGLDYTEFQSELQLVTPLEPAGVVPVATSGFHLEGTLWVGESGRFYRTFYYDARRLERYGSVGELFAHDLGTLGAADELYLSVGGYAQEWGIGAKT